MFKNLIIVVILIPTLAYCQAKIPFEKSNSKRGKNSLRSFNKVTPRFFNKVTPRSFNKVTPRFSSKIARSSNKNASIKKKRNIASGKSKKWQELLKTIPAISRREIDLKLLKKNQKIKRHLEKILEIQNHSVNLSIHIAQGLASFKLENKKSGLILEKPKSGNSESDLEEVDVAVDFLEEINELEELVVEQSN